jgi:hypothetical protein
METTETRADLRQRQAEELLDAGRRRRNRAALEMRLRRCAARTSVDLVAVSIGLTLTAFVLSGCGISRSLAIDDLSGCLHDEHLPFVRSTLHLSGPAMPDGRPSTAPMFTVRTWDNPDDPASIVVTDQDSTLGQAILLPRITFSKVPGGIGPSVPPGLPFGQEIDGYDSFVVVWERTPTDKDRNAVADCTR